MKTLKLRSKEEVSEDALLEDMKRFLSSYREANKPEEKQDLPLYKQIKADVEERPLTVRAGERTLPVLLVSVGKVEEVCLQVYN